MIPSLAEFVVEAARATGASLAAVLSPLTVGLFVAAVLLALYLVHQYLREPRWGVIP